ncbi:inactive ubiquitin carboxyl-terminal hydrolase MINDY-4B isoform X3 [Pectinophora gossypiella]|uniref:inactive ubiquitin carboxyl-terminal hydrolase MINDY-4B isoform X3 n=1 Tax=Pectinophora gossypiella TaxID=13191 RepID=UPI00214E11C9|nr:inactive ubiquitin carboxyl-terminal hydrolase MINDY-4B isoform X3 [Pectinophora gossypiella]
MNKDFGNRWKNLKSNLPVDKKADSLVTNKESLTKVVKIAKEKERVLYARNKYPPGSKPAVVGGKPITEELAMELRLTIFGTASCPPRGEWVRSPLVMRPADQPLGYGLAAPRNGCRSLLAGLQAHIIKWLLFDSRPIAKDNKSSLPPDTYLRPSEERQDEATWRACSEIIWRCAGGFNPQPGVEPTAIIALPTDNSYVPHSTQYYQDQITETVGGALLHLFEFKNLEDVQIFVKRYLHLFQAEEGPGALLLLYAVVLTRGCENVKKDLDGKLTYLVSSHVEGSLNIVTLILTGRATPYLHNGVVYVGDEDHYAMPQFGVLSRSPVGLLVWYGGDESGSKNINKSNPGSRLKTPALPIWVTSCAGHYGILFNTNRELLRNYHAERRFDIHYYTCGGCHVLLNVDTRAHDESSSTMRNDDISATPLEKLIHTKWQDAKITWTGPGPTETPK